MLDISKDIDSLTNFKRNTTDFVQRLSESGKPIVLTINGKAELVVQDATSYQQLVELVDRLEAIAGIRQGLEDAKTGKAQDAREVLEDIRRKYNIPRDA